MKQQIFSAFIQKFWLFHAASQVNLTSPTTAKKILSSNNYDIFDLEYLVIANCELHICTTYAYFCNWAYIETYL
jgi:hypothetical protein